MYIAQVGQQQAGQGSVLTQGTRIPPLVPASASAPYGFNPSSPKAAQRQGMSISYTMAVTVALITSLIMSVVSVLATYAILSRRKPAKAIATEPDHRETEPLHQAEAKRLTEGVTVRNWFDGLWTENTVAIWPTDMEGREEFPPPNQKDGPRFHPRQQNSDCALHALQMLLGGNPALLPSVIDLQAAKHDLAPEVGNAFDKSTIVQPNEFPKIYQRLIESKVRDLNEALGKLDKLKESNAAERLTLRESRDHEELLWMSPQLSDRLELAKNIQGCAGKLEEHRFVLNDASLEAALSKALKKRVGPRIILAKPLIDGRLGALQEMLEFKHHYVSLEQEPDGLWVKRDPLREKPTPLWLNDERVSDPLDAVKAELTWEKMLPAGESNIDLNKPTHVFIPTAR